MISCIVLGWTPCLAAASGMNITAIFLLTPTWGAARPTPPSLWSRDSIDNRVERSSSDRGNCTSSLELRSTFRLVSLSSSERRLNGLIRGFCFFFLKRSRSSIAIQYQIIRGRDILFTVQFRDSLPRLSSQPALLLLMYLPSTHSY